MKRKTISIIICLLLILSLAGCGRYMPSEKVEMDNLPNQDGSPNNVISADNPNNFENSIKPEEPSTQEELQHSESLDKRIAPGSPVSFYYNEDVMVIAFTDKLVDEFFAMVEEGNNSNASIELSLNYEFTAKLEYLPADTLNNMPYLLRASYENKTASYYAESLNPFGQIESGDSPKISCMRNKDTLFLICKAHGFSATDAKTATVDMIFISQEERYRSENYYIRRHFDSSSVNFSQTVPEGADSPIPIPLENDLSEFKLVDRYTPVSDDYLLYEYDYEISTHLEIVSYDEYGLPIECVTVCDYKDPNMEDFVVNDLYSHENKEADSLQFFSEGSPDIRRYLSKPFLTAKQMHH